MSGLVFVGLVLVLNALMRANGQHGLFLWMIFGVTVITAECEAADNLLDSTHQPLKLLGDLQSATGSPPLASPPSEDVALESPDTPDALPTTSEPVHKVGAAGSMPFKWENVASENSQSSEKGGLLTDQSHLLSIPVLKPSKTVLKLGQTNSDKYSFSHFPTPTRSQLPDQSTIYVTSLSPSRFAKSITPQLKLNSEQKSIFSKQQNSASEQTILTSLPGQPVYSANLDFADSPANQSYSNVLDVSPSRDPFVWNNPAYDINMLTHPDEFQAPGHNVPVIFPHPTTPSTEPTDVSSDDFYPTNTMEIDWGSGDYLETMSFLDPGGQDYYPVTKVPSDLYDLEDYTEKYDTSFPSRVGISPSSFHPHHISLTPSLMTGYSANMPLKSIYTPSSPSTIDYTLKFTSTSDIFDVTDVDWTDTFTVQPTDVLLPDMNSLEYYTTQLTRENNRLDTGAEHRGNVTIVSVSATDITPTSSFTNYTNSTGDDPSGDLTEFEPHDESNTVATAEDSPHLVNTSEAFISPSIVPTHFFDSSSSSWSSQVSTADWPAATITPSMDSTTLSKTLVPTSSHLLPDDVISYSTLTDVHWFITESVSQTTMYSSPVLSSTIALLPVPTIPAASSTPVEFTLQDSTFTTGQNFSSVLTEPTSPFTSPDVLVDQGVTEDGVDIPATTILIPASSDANTFSAVPTTSIATNTSHQTITGTAPSTEAATNINSLTTSGRVTTTATASRQYLCNVDRPLYLVKIGFPSGTTIGYAKSQVRGILKAEFNNSVELQVVDPPPKFLFRVLSGPVVYTAISVINALQRSGHHFLSVSPNWTSPDHKYQIHTVLQFVPTHIDVRFCNFSESIEKGLTLAFAEVRRRSMDSTNFTVHIVNITVATPKVQEQRLAKQPVDITFTVLGSRGYLMGSEVSIALMELTVVEFSYYMGFPVLQIAEPFHYPELNTSQLLRSSWVRTVLLGVLDQKVGERTFQANMERRVAMLLGEAMGLIRRVKRATTIGNNSVQVVSTSRLVGVDNPLEIVYFVEGPSGQRMPADQASNVLNSMDVQRAAIILGYRVQGVLAQPVEKVASLPSDAENTTLWIVIGVVIPLLVVIIIISILYWKLCRTDKLEFQPDAMTSIQQRQKMQTPSVKGFDFAKLHLGQHSKDDVMVIQEPVLPGPVSGPLPMPTKDGPSPSEKGELPTPISKHSVSSTKASRSGRRPERISPSDGDSVVSDYSSERESTEENLRGHVTPSDSKHARKIPINVLNGPPPPMNGANEQLSSASIFEHVDRMSRSADASRRLPNKVQLIAMQPMPLPPLHGTPINNKLSDTNQINKEIQVALRHKSEIEHHRNKIRLRAKRKGHYDFPAMDDMTSGLTDGKDQDHIYQKLQTQNAKMLDTDAQMPSIFMGSKKSARGRRSPKQRAKEQLNGGRVAADKDQLISEDGDAAYRKCPGVNNVAYVSDPDQGQGSPHRSPSPTDDIFLSPACSPPGHAPPPHPYMPPLPSIEEARQQMHSLLDDAFALVSPTSQSSSAGITLPGVNTNPPSSSPPGRGPRHWNPSYAALGPFSGRYTELGLSPPSVPITRQGLGSSYLPTRDTAGQCEQLQPDSLFTSRGRYADELPSSTRPRPVGGSAGVQLHHLTQVGLSSRMNGFPVGVRATSGRNGGVSWNHYPDDNFSKIEPETDTTPRSVIREPSAPPVHLDTPGVSYLSAAPPLETSPPTHSSASLIKAIREELLRLSQKQAAVPSYHS